MTDDCDSRHASGLRCDGKEQHGGLHSAFLPGLPICTVVGWENIAALKLWYVQSGTNNAVMSFGSAFVATWEDGLWHCAKCASRKTKVVYAKQRCPSSLHTGRRIPQVKCNDCGVVTVFCPCAACASGIEKEEIRTKSE